MRTLHGKRFVDKQVDIFFWTETMIRTAKLSNPSNGPSIPENPRKSAVVKLPAAINEKLPTCLCDSRNIRDLLLSHPFSPIPRWWVHVWKHSKIFDKISLLSNVLLCSTFLAKFLRCINVWSKLAVWLWLTLDLMKASFVWSLMWWTKIEWVWPCEVSSCLLA